MLSNSPGVGRKTDLSTTIRFLAMLQCVCTCWLYNRFATSATRAAMKRKNDAAEVEVPRRLRVKTSPKPSPRPVVRKHTATKSAPKKKPGAVEDNSFTAF